MEGEYTLKGKRVLVLGWRGSIFERQDLETNLTSKEVKGK